MKTNVRPTQSSYCEGRGGKPDSWKWQLVWLFVPTAPYDSALSVTSSLYTALRGFIWKQEFHSHTSGTKYLHSLLQAASTKLGAIWLSQQPCFCWQPRGPHSVHITWCKFSRTGLTQGPHKCFNIAQISSALYMQNTFIILSFNTLFSHKIVLSAGRTWQINLFTNDLRMKQYLMNCGLYIPSTIKNTR